MRQIQGRPRPTHRAGRTRRALTWRLVAMGIAGAVVAGAVPDARAKDMDGRFGIGIEQSLGGVSGLGIRYFVSNALCLDALAGIDLAFVPKDGKTEVSAGFQGSAGIAFHFARSLHANLSIGLRISLAYRELDALKLLNPAATDAVVDVSIEIPLALEVWLADSFSLGASTGILVDFVPASGAQFSGEGAGSSAPAGATGLGFGSGTVVATLALMYYF